MSNVLSEAKKQQVIALGRLGWPLRRIEQETGVRRETDIVVWPLTLSDKSIFAI
jgi:hypothetical protein